MTIVVTGSGGFLGRHLVLGLRSRGHQVLEIESDTPEAEKLESLGQAEFVFHLAGVNRPKDQKEFETGNLGTLQELCQVLGSRPVPIMLSSSIQAELDQPYGTSKRLAEEHLTAHVQASGGTAHIYRFPNLFGKWVRPDYNSAIATFCDRIARGQAYQVNDRSTVLTLNYIDDVVDSLCALPGLEPSPGTTFRHAVEPVFKKSLGEIVDMLLGFKEGRLKQYLPLVADPFEKRLYSTYLTYVPFGDIPVPVDMKHDDRGWLFELAKSPAFGQIFVSTTKPGISRGNHWHHTKVERFCLIKGKGLIRFRQIQGGDIVEIPVDDQNIRVVDIPPGYTHSITNTADHDMIVLFWANEVFDPARPDTTFLKVEP